MLSCVCGHEKERLVYVCVPQWIVEQSARLRVSLTLQVRQVIVLSILVPQVVSTGDKGTRSALDGTSSLGFRLQSKL
jgi:hypothetical protein